MPMRPARTQKYRSIVAKVATLSDEVLQLLHREPLTTGLERLRQGCMHTIQTLGLLPSGSPNARICAFGYWHAIVDSEKTVDCLAHSNHSATGQLLLESSSGDLFEDISQDLRLVHRMMIPKQTTIMGDIFCHPQREVHEVKAGFAEFAEDAACSCSASSSIFCMREEDDCVRLQTKHQALIVLFIASNLLRWPTELLTALPFPLGL